jgi:hypothetical protein
MGKARLHLTFPAAAIDEPLLHEVPGRFGVSTVIARSNADDRFAWVILEVEGEPDRIADAGSWLQEKGISVAELEAEP